MLLDAAAALSAEAVGEVPGLFLEELLAGGDLEPRLWDCDEVHLWCARDAARESMPSRATLPLYSPAATSAAATAASAATVTAASQQ